MSQKTAEFSPIIFCQKYFKHPCIGPCSDFMPGANPTTSINNATGSLARFENKKIYLKNAGVVAVSSKVVGLAPGHDCAQEFRAANGPVRRPSRQRRLCRRLPVWPDWAKFRLKGDCFNWAVFSKLQMYRRGPILWLTLKVMHSLGQKWVGQHSGRAIFLKK
jgi:hypothetical protein